MIIHGKAIAGKRLEILKFNVSDLKIKPKLAVVMAGNDPASEIYVRLKTKKAEEVGIKTEVYRRSELVKLIELIKLIKRLNEDPTVTGILVQLPLPKRLEKETDEVLKAVDPSKDVDGLSGKSKFLPATVKAVVTILKEIWGEGVELSIRGKIITVIGLGRLIGKPLADYFEKMGARVNRCDENLGREEIRQKGKEADILVSATGKSGMITVEMVKPGAVVIDCGSPVAEVDFENVKNIASAVTPVPGGVGPVTVASLLENTVEAAKIQNNTHT